MNAESAPRRRGWLWLLTAALALAAAVVVLFNAPHLPIHSDLKTRKAYFEQQVRDGKMNLDEESRLAQVYWQLYPDVAENSYFGRDGLLGVFGAREHFERFGRSEGRSWGAGHTSPYGGPAPP